MVSYRVPYNLIIQKNHFLYCFKNYISVATPTPVPVSLMPGQSGQAPSRVVTNAAKRQNDHQVHEPKHKKQLKMLDLFQRKPIDTNMDPSNQAAKIETACDVEEALVDPVLEIEEKCHTLEGKSLDISNYFNSTLTDKQKDHFIKVRVPEHLYKFPSREYKDKRAKSGTQRRYCLHEYFTTFDFIIYSKLQDGLYCLACMFFPTKPEKGMRAKLLIETPYRNWKDCRSDLSNHATLQYHTISMTKMRSFIKTMAKPSARIDMQISSQVTEQVSTNRAILKSIIKCLEVCGRQGISLRGHRDDGSNMTSSDDVCNKGNFKALVKLCAESGDHTLQQHLATCARNATYVSKTSQNQLLDCMKEFIQSKIVSNVKNQAVGALYGIMADEVTDVGNWEQLGILLRYVDNNVPVEKLLAYVRCDTITGDAISDNIIQTLTQNGLDPSKCRSQTYDGAGNMAGCQKGCAAMFMKKTSNPAALYLHCASHNLNLALSKACGISEIQCMTSALTSVGLFFKYSPKRSRQLEASVRMINDDRNNDNKITKSKIKPLCETRWVERHTSLEDFRHLYEPLLDCLQFILTTTGWDMKTTTEANGLFCQITSTKFISAFVTCSYIFGYTKALSVKLQSSNIDVAQAYSEITTIIDVLRSVREDAETEFSKLFEDMKVMSVQAGVEITIPRRCGRQTLRNNIPSDIPEVYYRRTIFIPFLDKIISELETRFSQLAKCATRAMHLIPSNLHNLVETSINELNEFYGPDLPFRTSLRQEIRLWRQLWGKATYLPTGISETLTSDCVSYTSYPNICTILHILMLTAATSAGVERANSSLRFVKNVYRSSMGEERFNALILLFVHKDITIDYESIINMYSSRHPRRMLMQNPLAQDLK